MPFMLPLLWHLDLCSRIYHGMPIYNSYVIKIRYPSPIGTRRTRSLNKRCHHHGMQLAYSLYKIVFEEVESTRTFAWKCSRTGNKKDVVQMAAISNVITKIPFLSELSDSELNQIKGIFIERQFTRNQIILYEEDTGKSFYYVIYGKVKVIQYSPDGRERILAIHGRGDFFGEISILDGKTLPANVVAMEDTKVGFIYREQFERYLLGNERVLKAIIAMLCNRLRESWLMLKVMSFNDAEQRLRIGLKTLGDHHGVKDANDVVINIRVTHDDIAKLAAISRETATRLLNRFKKAGDIKMLADKRIRITSDFIQKISML